MPDILFKEQDFIFSLRVGGVLIRDGKTLLQKAVADEDGYAVIGGHIAAFETAAQTLQREYLEELHAPVSVGKLLAVSESYWQWGKRPCHQLCLYFEVTLSEETAIPLAGVFTGFHENGSTRPDIAYHWMPLEELPRHTVYPEELFPLLAQDMARVHHIVSNQLDTP